MKRLNLVATALLVAPALGLSSGNAFSAEVAVEFSLDITRGDLGWAQSDPNFNPFTTTLSLQFDPAFRERFSNGESGEIFFAGANAFTTPLTGQLPWTTPAALPEYHDRNLAIFGFEQLSPTERQTHMYWDDSYRYNDGAGLEYGYAISVETDYQLGELIDISPDTFDTTDLLSYLQLHQQLDRNLNFGVVSWIWDYNAQEVAAFRSFAGDARITNIDTSAVVPLPPAAVLMLSGLSVLRLVRRRPTPPLHALELGGRECAEMVRRYAHLSSEHLAVYTERMSGTTTNVTSYDLATLNIGNREPTLASC